MRRLILLLLVLLVTACGATGTESSTVRAVQSRPEINLPAPDEIGSRSLEEVIGARRSIREYADRPLDPTALSQLLWATQGETSASGKRAAPSAGALYPLEVYVVDRTGVYHYVPEGHRLKRMVEGDLRSELSAAALDQVGVAEAAAVFVITAVEARTAAKYGDRAGRYMTLEAGHAAQNLLLQAVALDLGAVPVGAFDDADVQRVLSLPADHEPLYLIPVGHPQREDG